MKKLDLFKLEKYEDFIENVNAMRACWYLRPIEFIPLHLYNDPELQYMIDVPISTLDLTVPHVYNFLYRLHDNDTL